MLNYEMSYFECVTSITALTGGHLGMYYQLELGDLCSSSLAGLVTPKLFVAKTGNRVAIGRGQVGDQLFNNDNNADHLSF